MGLTIKATWSHSTHGKTVMSSVSSPAFPNRRRRSCSAQVLPVWHWYVACTTNLLETVPQRQAAKRRHPSSPARGSPHHGARPALQAERSPSADLVVPRQPHGAVMGMANGDCRRVGPANGRAALGSSRRTIICTCSLAAAPVPTTASFIALARHTRSPECPPARRPTMQRHGHIRASA